jgi:hypothetical protein
LTLRVSYMDWKIILGLGAKYKHTTFGLILVFPSIF